MSPSRPTAWLAACAGSALLLAAVVLFLAHHRLPPSSGPGPAPVTAAAATQPPLAPPPGSGPGPAPVATAAKQPPPAPPPSSELACGIADPVLRRAQPEAENPPVILWAAGKVRLFLDGHPEFSPPEAPKRFRPGEHLLRVEAEGVPTVETRIRLSAFQPALVHAQRDDGLGVSLLRLGVVCASCNAPLTPVEAFEGELTSVSPNELLSQAAEALRHDHWELATVLLGSVPSQDRQHDAWHRLASAAWLDAASPAKARAEAEAIHDRELATLLHSFDALTRQEQARYAEVVLVRWNRVTEQHAALLREANGMAGVDTALSEQRLEALSAEFHQALAARSTPKEEQVFDEAEAAVGGLLSRLLKARPGDCALRTRLATALAEAGGAP